MKSINWLKRKYPNSFDELNEYFNESELEDFKKSTRKIGRLTRDVIHGYEKGTIIQFRRSNPVRDYNYPLVYCIAKCQPGFTTSGYHSFDAIESDFIELKN